MRYKVNEVCPQSAKNYMQKFMCPSRHLFTSFIPVSVTQGKGLHAFYFDPDKI